MRDIPLFSNSRNEQLLGAVVSGKLGVGTSLVSPQVLGVGVFTSFGHGGGEARNGACALMEGKQS